MRIPKVKGEEEEFTISSSCSSFLCLLLFGFVKLAFAAVLAEIEAVLWLLTAYLQNCFDMDGF
jgi:hypothetical protein